MSALDSLLVELEKNALDGDPSARQVLEHPVTEMLLKAIMQTPIPSYMRFDVPYTKLISKEDGKRRIIHGYASVQAIDKQGELITTGALQKAWTRMQKAGEKYANINLEHSNITLGKILLDEKVQDSEGKEYWSHVDENGLYIVAELRDDIEIADKVWEMANRGELNAFSIGGRSLKKRLVRKEQFNTFLQIDDLELYEVTICKRGKNTLSGFQVLKSYYENGIIDEETYLAKSAELEKSESIIKELTLLPKLVETPIILSENFIRHTGHPLEKSQEKHTFDLLVKMDADNPIRRQIETRILKAIDPNLWGNVDFEYSNKTEATPLFHLALIPAGVEKREGGFGSADFPDSCFAWVPAEAKGPDGKKSLRKLPYKNKDGSVSLPHVRNALARLGQTQGIPEGEKETIRTRLERILSENKSDSDSVDNTVDRTLKNIDERKTSIGDDTMSEQEKSEASAGSEVAGGTPEDPVAKLQKQVTDLEQRIANMTKASPPAEEEKPKEEEKECKEEKADAPKEEEEKSDAVAPEVISAIADLKAKGIPLPESLQAVLETDAKKAEEARIASLETTVSKMGEKLDSILKAVQKPAEAVKKGEEKIEKSDSSLSDDDIQKIARAASTILKSEGSSIKKSEGTPGINPDNSGSGPAPQAMTLGDFKNMSWSQVHELNAKRSALVGA